MLQKVFKIQNLYMKSMSLRMFHGQKYRGTFFWTCFRYHALFAMTLPTISDNQALLLMTLMAACGKAEMCLQVTVRRVTRDVRRYGTLT